jgi:hypothetical protein
MLARGSGDFARRVGVIENGKDDADVHNLLRVTLTSRQKERTAASSFPSPLNGKRIAR